MDEAEDAYPDPRLEALIRESGMAWPRDDAQLDAWLSAQALSDDDERWLKEVMLRRLHEARGPSLGIDLGPAEAGEPEAASVTVKSAPARPRRLTYDDLALLNGQLLELVEVGVALPVGLQAFAEDVRGGELEHVLARLRADLEQGLPLSAALARQGEAFPPLYRSLVSAGEAGGDLAACLGLLHEQAEVDAEFDRRVRLGFHQRELRRTTWGSSLGPPHTTPPTANAAAPRLSKTWSRTNREAPNSAVVRAGSSTPMPDSRSS